MDCFSYLLQDIDPLLLDEVDFEINSCGKSDNYMKDLGSKINGEKVEGPEIYEHFLGNNIKSHDFGFVSEFSDNFKKIESLIDSDNFKKQDSMVEDSPARKRMQAATKNYDYRSPVCQVQGCNKDLRSSKDYHRKNRVCAIHAKSAKVFVNGIEKRFCQQCSRFHLLKEFDDVKRSCRKRLAGHNERRRKPYILPHIAGRDSSLSEIDLVTSESFFPREKYPTSFYYQENYVDDRFKKIPGAKEVEFPMPFAPSLLSFNNSNKYANNSSSQNPKPLHPEITKSCPADYKSTKPKSSEKSEYFQKNPFIYDETAVICSEITERYYYKDRRFYEAAGGSTLDLLHLSPHLQRVEKLQNSVQMMQENITFSCI